jgi:hypothetical protein
LAIPIEKLSEGFPATEIKTRKGNFGNTLQYLESSTVIQRLNDVVPEWNFKVIEHFKEKDEVVVLGEMEIAGIVHQTFGCSKIAKNKDTGAEISLGDDRKAAVSDAIKKAASMFGVGLSLHTNGNGHRPSPGNNGNGNDHKSNGNGNGNGYKPKSGDRISNREITDLFTTCKNKGIQQSQVIKTAQETYQKSIGQLTSIEAKNLVEQLT